MTEEEHVPREVPREKSRHEARIKELDRQISNLRWRRGRDLRDGLDYRASKIGQEIDSLVRERNDLVALAQRALAQSSCASSGEDSYADLDRLDPTHAEEHRKEISRLYGEQHGLPALEKLGERCLADVRHEKERMREEWMAEGIEWVMGE